MYGASLSFRKAIIIAANTFASTIVLALYHCYVQAKYEFGSLKKASSTEETTHTPVAASNAMFSKITEHCSKTMYAYGCVLFHLDIFIVVEKQETALSNIYKQRLNSYTVLSFSYLE